MKTPEEIIAALRWLAMETEFVFGKEQLIAAADMIEELQSRANQAALNYQHKCRDVVYLESQLSESQRREKAAVEAIRKSLRHTGNQRPHLNRCHECKKSVVNSKMRKYKYGCESLCGNALQIMVECGFKTYEPLIPFADDWRGPEEDER